MAKGAFRVAIEIGVACIRAGGAQKHVCSGSISCQARSPTAQVLIERCGSIKQTIKILHRRHVPGAEILIEAGTSLEL